MLDYFIKFPDTVNGGTFFLWYLCSTLVIFILLKHASILSTQVLVGSLLFHLFSKTFLYSNPKRRHMFFVFLLLDRRDDASKYHYKRGHHRPASETSFKWPKITCWLGSFVSFRGSRPVCLRNRIFFVIFQGGSGLPALPPLDPPMRK